MRKCVAFIRGGGGGRFSPFLILQWDFSCLVVVGMPMYFMEAAIGQFAQVTYINSILNTVSLSRDTDALIILSIIY